MVNFLTKDIIDIHQTFGFMSLCIALCGFCIAYKFRRATVFRVKLAFAFCLPLIVGIVGIVDTNQKYHIVQHVMTISFMMLMTILYWREVKYFVSSEGYHRRSLADYLDNVPDLIWIKDIDFRFTYINKAVEKKFNIRSKDILGKTDAEIARMLGESGIMYEFGNICTKSDIIVSHEKMPKMFLEMGAVGDTFIALQVYKGPIYRSDKFPKEHIGYISVGRDLTYDVEDHDKIEQLWLDGDFDAAFRMFCVHKNRYMSLFEKSGKYN